MICTTQVRTPSMDRHFSRNSNTAGAPLPLIPRRSSSSTHAHTISSPTPTTPCKSTKFQAQFKIQPPTPETVVLPASQKGHLAVENSDSSSSSLSSDSSMPTIARRPKRVLGQRFPAVRPPEFSTPTPAVFRAKASTSRRRPSSENPQQVEACTIDSDDNETPRPFYSVPPRNQSVLPLQDLVVMPGLQVKPSTEAPEAESFVQIPPSIEARLIRKKSGEPVKSSLKSVKSSARGSLSVFTHEVSSKSEPNTPTHAKAVHFDSHLEHVKLFLAEQKPLAVSRDGSPTDDTSGTDTDFPFFIFGSPEEGSAERDLVMEVTNMPPRINTNADVALEGLRLSRADACILGSVRVRNIAFQKWLAVRFTFDDWQTTSEVTAKHAESLCNGSFDRFIFTIRLNDMLPRIEGKTLVLALRYTVEGREIWDNNNHQNYHANFAKRRVLVHSEAGASTTNDIADLKSQLEKVVLGGDGRDRRRRRNALVSEEDKTPVLKEGNFLASRYDFATSLKSPWKPAKHPSPPRHLRTNSYPSNHSSPGSIPWPSNNTWFKDDRMEGSTKPKDELGSPRDLDVVRFGPATYGASDSEESLPITSRAREGRNHKRGYFDQGFLEASSVKKTLAGTPLLTPTSFYSFPSVGDRPSRHYDMLTPTRPTSRLLSGHFVEGTNSTPSTSSPSSSSRSMSPSPTGSFLMEHLPSQGDQLSATSPTADYNQFLNKFCFFTGSDTLPDTSTEAIPRSHSVEDLLLTQSPRSSFLSHFATPTRNPSYDDIVSRSGSSTPTARSFGTFESRPLTAVN